MRYGEPLPGTAAIRNRVPQLNTVPVVLRSPFGAYSARRFSRASERVEFAAPGSLQPARFVVEIKDLIWDTNLSADFRRSDGVCRRLESPPVSDHPELSELGIRGPYIPPAGAGDMALIHSIAGQAIQMLVVLAMAPLLTGLVRKIKARLLRRAGPRSLSRTWICSS